MAATPKTMQQSTLSFGLGLTGVAPPPAAVRRDASCHGSRGRRRDYYASREGE